MGGESSQSKLQLLLNDTKETDHKYLVEQNVTEIQETKTRSDLPIKDFPKSLHHLCCFFEVAETKVDSR